MHKIQSLEEDIVPKTLFKHINYISIANPFQTYFSKDLSVMYLVNCNKVIHFSSIYTV